MATPQLEHVLIEVADGIATVTINRPKALNALNTATIDDLSAAIDFIAASDDVRGVIVTGAGDRAFVAGADIAAMAESSGEGGEAFSKHGSDVFARLEALPKPVIAAVNGFALGGGCELMLACDFAYASESARFGQPEVNLGLIAGFGGTQRLTRKVPYGAAMELLLTGRIIRADEALRIGLVNRVVPGDELMSAVRETMTEILSKGPVAVALTKRMVVQAEELGLTEGLRSESAAFGEVFATEDAREGTRAFVDKRAANFTGR